MDETTERTGEVNAILADLKKDGEAMLKDLMEVDSLLQDMESKINSADAVNKDELLETIREIRVRIGALEKEDEDGIKEEEIAENLLSKLRKWIDQIV